MTALDFIPHDLTVLSATGLVLLSFLTSAITASLGLGGGLILLVVLASFLPPLVVIPIHAVVQLGSNFGRASLLRQHINWSITGYFLVGSIFGVILAGHIFVALPAEVLRTILGLFVLYSIWTPKLRPSNIPLPGFLGVGAATSFASIFVGGTGPLVSAFLSPENMSRKTWVATHALCMTGQHGLKGIIFGFLGFKFLPWLPTLIAMILFGFLGTLAGKRVLNRLPEKLFKRFFRVIMTLLGMRLLLDVYLG
jgi:uncharacterized membrane protein YfcA